MKVLKFNYFKQSFIRNNCIIIKEDSLKNYFYICFIKNGKIHNENFSAMISSYKDYDGFSNLSKYFFYKDSKYLHDYTNKKWKKFVRKLKRSEKLKVFL